MASKRKEILTPAPRYSVLATAALISLCALLPACPKDDHAWPVPVTGQAVEWGGSGEPSSQPRSAPAMPHSIPHSDLAPTGKWSGGDPARGAKILKGKCLGCHAQRDDAPPIDREALSRLDDRDLARQIAHGHGAMPSFMGQFDRGRLLDIIAGLREDAGKTEAHGEPPAPKQPPTSQPAAAPPRQPHALTP